MSSAIPSELLGSVLESYRKYRELGEAALRQLPEDQLFHALDPTANSVAVIVKHLGGNLRSRWTDFLTTDGEKPDRQRDSEFDVGPGASRETVMAWWDAGWEAAFTAIEALRPTDLERVVTIRGEPLTVLQALQRNLTHTAYHVGQIVLLSKHLRAGDWTTLTEL